MPPLPPAAAVPPLPRAPDAAPAIKPPAASSSLPSPPAPPRAFPTPCLNPAAALNASLDARVELRVYPCHHAVSRSAARRKATTFRVKPEGVVLRGAPPNAHHPHGAARIGRSDLGAAYSAHVGRALPTRALNDARACQLLVTTHGGSYYVVPAPEAFGRHSGTCRLLGDRGHPPAPHALTVGDFLRVGSVGVVVVETHDGTRCRALSAERIRRIVRDTASGGAGFLDLAETDGENSDESSDDVAAAPGPAAPLVPGAVPADVPTCYMCFDEEDSPDDPLVSPCKCLGSTRYVHLECLRKWHAPDAENRVCFLSSVDATCSVCKTTFRSDVKLKDGRMVQLFKSTLEPPYVSLLVATKHEMAQRLFNTRFQLSFSTLLKPDGKNGTRPLLLGRSSGSDMVLDYRTVSARHASLRFKHGQFLFTDAGSSNGSYLYLRRPVELTSGRSVQFRLGRSIVSARVVSKWNRRLLAAVARRAGRGPGAGDAAAGREGDDDDARSVGSAGDAVRETDAAGGTVRRAPRRTREGVLAGLPPLGTLRQGSDQHLDLLYALAYPARPDAKAAPGPRGGTAPGPAPAGGVVGGDGGARGGGDGGAASGDAGPPPPARAPVTAGAGGSTGPLREDAGTAVAALTGVAQDLCGLDLEDKDEEEAEGVADSGVPPPWE